MSDPKWPSINTPIRHDRIFNGAYVDLDAQVQLEKINQQQVDKLAQQAQKILYPHLPSGTPPSGKIRISATDIDKAGQTIITKYMTASGQIKTMPLVLKKLK